MEERELLRRHISAIRSHSTYYECAPIIFIPENNYGMHDHLHNMISDMDNIHTYMQKGKYGVYKDFRVTREYRRYLSHLLFCKKLCFARRLVCVTRNKTSETIKLLLREQMERYHWEKKQAKDAFSTDKSRLTGKAGGKQDDLVITTMTATFWGCEALNNPRIRDAISK